MEQTRKINNIEVIVVATPEETGGVAAEQVLKILKNKPSGFFGFATGNSPQPLYRALIKDRKENNTDWSMATASDLDEWLPFSHPVSCHSVIDESILNHLNLRRRVYLPEPPYEASTGPEYEAKIKELGGYDLMILGVGINGHLAFCEPGTSFETRTGLLPVGEATLKRYEKVFGGIENVPKYGFTVGLQTIKDARKVVLIAFGEDKAEAVYHGLYDKPNENWIVSFLQLHPNVTFVLDEKAARLLK